MFEKVQTLTIEQFTIAFLSNQPLKERVPLQASSGNREKRNQLLMHCEKISTFSSRAKRAHGREAPRKTQTRGSERSTENPTGAEFWPKSVPSGRRVLILVILGRLSKEEIKRFSICFSNFQTQAHAGLNSEFLKFLRNFNLKVYWTRSERLQQKLVDSVPSITLVTLDQLTIVKTSQHQLAEFDDLVIVSKSVESF